MALAIDSQESGATAHRATTSGVALTWSFNNVAGNLICICVIVTEGGAGGGITTTAVSYAGTSALGNVAKTVSFGATHSSATIYYLTSPATGSNTVSVTATGTTNFAVLAGAISYSGADTGTPIGTTNSNTSTSSNHATAGSITPTSGNYALGVGGWGSGEAATADSGQSLSAQLQGSGNTAGDDIAIVDKASTGAAINLGFTWTTADNFGMVAIEIKASGGVAAPVANAPEANLLRPFNMGSLRR